MYYVYWFILEVEILTNSFETRGLWEKLIKHNLQIFSMLQSKFGLVVEKFAIESSKLANFLPPKYTNIQYTILCTIHVHYNTILG